MQCHVARKISHNVGSLKDRISQPGDGTAGIAAPLLRKTKRLPSLAWRGWQRAGGRPAAISLLGLAAAFTPNTERKTSLRAARTQAPAAFPGRLIVSASRAADPGFRTGEAASSRP